MLASPLSTRGGPVLTVIRCGTLIDGTGRPPVPEARILVEGDRIAAVGDAAGVEAPPGAAVIDLSGSTVLPGLIDSHTHLMLGFGDDLEERDPQPELYQMLKCVPHLRAHLLPRLPTLPPPNPPPFLP